MDHISLNADNQNVVLSFKVKWEIFPKWEFKSKYHWSQYMQTASKLNKVTEIYFKLKVLK